MITLKYSQSRSPGEALISHPQGRCSSLTHNLLKSLGCNEDQAPVARPALCCATASRFSNFQGESDWSQAWDCTESTNHPTETSGAPKPQEGSVLWAKGGTGICCWRVREGEICLNITDLGYTEVPLVSALLIPCSLLVIKNNKKTKTTASPNPVTFSMSVYSFSLCVSIRRTVVRLTLEKERMEQSVCVGLMYVQVYLLWLHSVNVTLYQR